MAKYKVTVGKKVLTHEADKYTVDAGILILWNSKEGNHARPVASYAPGMWSNIVEVK
jgi:hypothetical protein